MAVLTVSEARATLPELLTRVDEHGEEISITRHGRVVAVLVAPGVLRIRRAGRAFERAAEIHALLEQAASEPLDVGGGLDSAYAEELVREIRRDRDEDPWDRVGR